jgi:hypothetical protein
MGTGGKARPGRDSIPRLHPEPKSRMSRSYTSSPSWCLHGIPGQIHFNLNLLPIYYVLWWRRGQLRLWRVLTATAVTLTPLSHKGWTLEPRLERVCSIYCWFCLYISTWRRTEWRERLTFEAEPAKKVTRGGVLHKGKTSCVARLKPFLCTKRTVRIEKGSLKYSNWGYAYALGLM